MRGLTLTGLAAGLTSLLVVAGCPAGECQGNRDCGTDEFCNAEGQCAPLGPPGPGIGEGEGEGEIPSEGEGEGEPNVDTLVDTTVPITMFNRLDATTAIVGVGDPASGLDQIREFDLATGELGPVVRNFQNGPAGNCFVDTIHFFDESAPAQDFLILPEGDETWYSCTNGNLFVQYGDDFTQAYESALPSAEIVQLLPVNDGQANGASARLLVASRGGNALAEVRIGVNGSPDNINTERASVPVLPGEFSAIMDIIVLAEDDPQLGDLVLIFDRAQPPRFVPIQRLNGTDNWVSNPALFNGTILAPIELPAETHFALFLEDVGIPDLQNLAIGQAEQDRANIVVLMPELGAGTVRFLRYESEQFDLGVRFQDLDLQVSDAQDVVTPPASDRVLIEEVTVGGDRFFMYSLTTSDHVWRFPLHRNQNDNRVNDVRRAQFTNPADEPLGMIPFPGNPDFVWVGHSNRNFIELLELENIR